MHVPLGIKVTDRKRPPLPPSYLMQKLEKNGDPVFCQMTQIIKEFHKSIYSDQSLLFLGPVCSTAQGYRIKISNA
jgi:hypothetical protein